MKSFPQKFLLLNISVCLAPVILASCLHPNPKKDAFTPLLLDVTVSMTHDSGVSDQSLEKMEWIEERWCHHKDVSLAPKNARGNPAMVDEVILKVQKERGADYITRANIYLQGDQCAYLKGAPAKIVVSKVDTPIEKVDQTKK